MKTKLISLGFAALLFAGCSKNGADVTTASSQSSKTSPTMVNSTMSVNVTGTAAIDAGAVQQTVQGFGGASILAWEADLTSTQRTEAFSTSSGIGMSILRVMVPSTGTGSFAAEKPTIDAAKGFGARVIATAWNAPPA